MVVHKTSTKWKVFLAIDSWNSIGMVKSENFSDALILVFSVYSGSVFLRDRMYCINGVEGLRGMEQRDLMSLINESDRIELFILWINKIKDSSYFNFHSSNNEECGSMGLHYYKGMCQHVVFDWIC